MQASTGSDVDVTDRDGDGGDRRALLRYVLEREWPRLSLPAAAAACEDLDLDAVNVPDLLAALRVPGGSPDLKHCGLRSGPGSGSTLQADFLSSEHTADGAPQEEGEPPAAVSATVATQPRTPTPPPHDYASSSYVSAVVSLDSLLQTPSLAVATARSSDRSPALIQPIPGTPNSPASTHFSVAADLAGVAAPIPDLVLVELRGGGDALHATDAVAQCAFELFAATVVGSFRGNVDDDLVDVVRMALEIPPEMGSRTTALLAPHLDRINAADPEGVGLRVHLRLMAEAAGCGVLDPTAAAEVFGSGAAGAGAQAAWVRRQAAVLTEALWTVHDRTTAAVVFGDGAGTRDGTGGQTPHLYNRGDDDDDDVIGHTAHVGAVIEEVSRLMARISADSVAAEGGTAALTAVVEAVAEMVEGALDAAGAGAWSYPPALAGRMYAQLMRAAFDPLEEGALADEAEAVIVSLTGEGGAGRALGVSGAAHRAIFAWSLARHHQEASCGVGLLGLGSSLGSSGTGGARGTPGARAFAAALEAEAEDEEGAYRLLATAAHALSTMRSGGLAGVSSGDDATLALVHAALGPLVWWVEGALGDFFNDVDRGGAHAQGNGHGPTMTPDGFAAVLELGVAAARARGATAAATAPGGGGEGPAAAAAGDEAGRTLAARVCKHSVGEAYARLRVTANEANNAADKAAAGGGGGEVEGGDRSIAPGMRLLAEGCAAMADSYEAHLSSRVVAAAGPAAANAAPAAVTECFSADLCLWLDMVPPLDSRAREALWAAQDMQNAVAAAVMDRCDGKVGGVGDGDVVGKAGERGGGGGGGFDFEPLQLEARVAPLIFHWVAGRLDVMRRTMQRSIKAETWCAAVSSTSASYASDTATAGTALSAVELMRAAWDTLEAFWKLALPAPVAALRALTEGLDGAFQAGGGHRGRAQHCMHSSTTCNPNLYKSHPL